MTKNKKRISQLRDMRKKRKLSISDQLYLESCIDRLVDEIRTVKFRNHGKQIDKK